MTASLFRPSGAVRDHPAPLADSPRRAEADLAVRYRSIRAQTEALCAPLETEDYVVSSMPDVSPTKWHLAHTSWFFETFVLASHATAAGFRYAPPDPRYAYLFNSYYVQAGERHCRAKRGLVTRPTVRRCSRTEHTWTKRWRACSQRWAMTRSTPPRCSSSSGSTTSSSTRSCS